MDETPTRSSYDAWIGNDVVDIDGDKIGKITDIFYDDETGRPEWVAVKTGLFGSNDTFVPLQGSSVSADGRALQVPFTKDFVKDSPNVVEGAHMTPQEEAALWTHYGYDYQGAGRTGYGANYESAPRADRDFRASRYDRERETWRDDDQDEIIAEATAVSEHAVTERVPETVRLRKYRRTEMVPVVKEEIRVEKDTETRVEGTETRVEGTERVERSTGDRSRP